MAKEKAVPFDFAEIMALSGPYLNQSSNVLYRMAPQTARAASGYTGTGMMTPAMLRKGAMGVSTMGATRFPLVSGGLQFLSGDPIGRVGTALGGFTGAKLGAKAGIPLAGATGGLSIPIGAVIGGLLGGGAGQSLTRGLAGIDINDPLTGPDFSLPIGKDGFPLTQYARTKKSVKRAMELEKMRLDQILPIIEKAKDRQFQRDLVSGQMQMAGQLLGNIYPR